MYLYTEALRTGCIELDDKMSNICINSEIGALETVVLHQPGFEIERMTPTTAADVLYDDILHLPRALSEHNQLEFILSRFAQTHELLELLLDVLNIPAARKALLDDLCASMQVSGATRDWLDSFESRALAFQLIGGTLRVDTSLESFLNPDRYAIPPLANFFFMRDAAMCVNDRVISGVMANRVRVAEAVIMKQIFTHHPAMRGSGFYLDGTQAGQPASTIEGGDVLLLREDVLLIGESERTSISGIDALIQRLIKADHIKHIFVVQIPKLRATIHLDMIFTMVDMDKCVAFTPFITGPKASNTIHIRVEKNAVKAMQNEGDLLPALKRVGIDLEVIPCGGTDFIHQEREQWTSGANFFTIAPGKIIGYGRNRRTFEELYKHGFEIVRFSDVLSKNVDLHALDRFAVSIEGAELSRGGGGCRCMTLPVKRAAVPW